MHKQVHLIGSKLCSVEYRWRLQGSQGSDYIIQVGHLQYIQ